MARSLRSLRQVATLRQAIWHVAQLRFAPAFRALGVFEHFWPFSLRDIWATLLSPKWAEIFVSQMAGDETFLPLRFKYLPDDIAQTFDAAHILLTDS